MAAKLILKSGAVHTVDAYAEDITASWRAALSEGTTPIITYKKLYAGVSLPDVTIDVRELESVEQERR